MNGLEVDFLFRINFSLHVTPDLFQKYREELLSHSNTEPVVPTPMPVAPVLNGGGVVMHHQHHLAQHHHSVEMDIAVESRPNSTSTTDHVEKRRATYITPSPPPEASARPGEGDYLGLENPYLQRANTMPQYTASSKTARRCSPNPMYHGRTNTEPYFMDAATITYPIHHGTLVHHNHATPAATKHGFHHPPHHQSDPSYVPEQYFMGRGTATPHMLTGCSGS